MTRCPKRCRRGVLAQIIAQLWRPLFRPFGFLHWQDLLFTDFGDIAGTLISPPPFLFLDLLRWRTTSFWHDVCYGGILHGSLMTSGFWVPYLFFPGCHSLVGIWPYAGSEFRLAGDWLARRAAWFSTSRMSSGVGPRFHQLLSAAQMLQLSLVFSAFSGLVPLMPCPGLTYFCLRGFC